MRGRAAAARAGRGAAPAAGEHVPGAAEGQRAGLSSAPEASSEPGEGCGAGCWEPGVGMGRGQLVPGSWGGSWEDVGREPGVPGRVLWQGGSGLCGSCPALGGERVTLPHCRVEARLGHWFGLGMRVWARGSLAGVGGKMSGFICSIFAESL